MKEDDLIIALYIIAALIVVYAVFCVAPSLVMFAKVFYRRTEAPDQPKKEYYTPFAERIDKANATLDSLPFYEVRIKSHDGLSLVADRYDGAGDKLAILFHGYRASPRANCAYQAALLADEGYSLLLVHQRAHGKSEGKVCTLGRLESVDTLDWIRYAQSDARITDIVLYGVSMGCVALSYASDKLDPKRVRAMVLDCGFSSIYDQLASDCKKMKVPIWAVLPWLRIFYKLRFKLDIKEKVGESLKNTRIPALFVHGEADTSVPFAHAKENFAACRSEKEALFVPEALHTCAMLVGGDEAKDTLIRFYNKYMENENE